MSRSSQPTPFLLEDPARVRLLEKMHVESLLRHGHRYDDDIGPIFPIGDVDPRHEPQAQVVGVTAPDGPTIAFPVDDLEVVLAAQDSVERGGIVITSDGSGFQAALTDGTPVAAHQSFWFAWSQFYPDAALWSGD